MNWSTTSAFTSRNLVSTPSNVSWLQNTVSRILITTPALTCREGVVSRLNDLVKLESGWDGYEGSSVSFENAHFALKVIESICRQDTPEPQIVPGVNGDLQIEWHHAGTDIELHIRAPNDVGAWRDTQLEEMEDEIKLTNDFAVVAKWLAEMTNGAVDLAATAA